MTPPACPLLIHFFHGRHTPDEDLDDWGFDGPLVAIEWYHSTYNSHLRIRGDNDDEFDISFVEYLVHIPGFGYFGDFSVFSAEAEPSLWPSVISVTELCTRVCAARTAETLDYQI